MAAFRIEWKKSALQELRRLDRSAIPPIVRAVEFLAADPLPPGVRQLKGGAHSYRIRAGDYRIIYTVFQHLLVVTIIRVRHRKDAYRT
jgi:mRNA interferase RelE/StbE